MKVDPNCRVPDFRSFRGVCPLFNRKNIYQVRKARQTKKLPLV